MTSKVSLSRVSEAILFELNDVYVDPSWANERDLVDSFKASIRQGIPPVPYLTLNRIRRPDGSFVLHIIDGSHRYQALHEEGVTSYFAVVDEYSERDAYYARIATTIGKPPDLVRRRAEEALRVGFLRDIASHLTNATIYQFGVAEDGTPQPRRRTTPLPKDPLLALGTLLWIHFRAKPEHTEEWEQLVLDWVEDIADRLGKSVVWVRDHVLSITALINDEIPGRGTAARARLLVSIPDDGIFREVLGRLKGEPHLTNDQLRFALDMLGCGPDVGAYLWLKRRSLPEIRGKLAQASLSQLAKDYNDALKQEEQRTRLSHLTGQQSRSGGGVPQPASPPLIETPQGHLSAADSGTPVGDRDLDRDLEDRSQVFGTASPTFAGTGSREQANKVPMPPFVPSRTYVSVHDDYSKANSLTTLLIQAWQAFDQGGGDWTRSDVQDDLSLLARHVERYRARGGATGHSTDTTSDTPTE